jgi:uncharacterized protein with ATP-grasp and redox domains
MKTSVDCLPCILRQAIKISRLSGSGKDLQLKVAREVAASLAEADMQMTPAENCMYIYKLIAELSDRKDPYLDIKNRCNEEVLKILPLLRREAAGADVPLITALRLALLGNEVPFTRDRLLDPDEIIGKSKTMNPVIDDMRSLLERISSLDDGAKILYLADNAGEIVYDTLVIELLVERGLDVTVAVKEEPVVTDALRNDAVECGLDEIAEIVSNGTACSGTPLRLCSNEFLEIFNRADLIISKGQGNFETLSQENREIVFIFIVKCHVVGATLKGIVNPDREGVYRPGDMVIFHSNG